MVETKELMNKIDRLLELNDCNLAREVTEGIEVQSALAEACDIIDALERENYALRSAYELMKIAYDGTDKDIESIIRKCKTCMYFNHRSSYIGPKCLKCKRFNEEFEDLWEFGG